MAMITESRAREIFSIMLTIWKPNLSNNVETQFKVYYSVFKNFYVGDIENMINGVMRGQIDNLAVDFMPSAAMIAGELSKIKAERSKIDIENEKKAFIHVNGFLPSNWRPGMKADTPKKKIPFDFDKDAHVKKTLQGLKEG